MQVCVSCQCEQTIINNTRLCNDIGKLSPVYQTSNVEAFHSLILQFAPKLRGYSYKGMLARLVSTLPIFKHFQTITSKK